MARCYGMSWDEFSQRGLGWYLTATTMNFLRPLGLGDRFIVRTWIEEFLADGVGVRVRFEIEKQETGKRCFNGHAEYKLVNLAVNRAAAVGGDSASLDQTSALKAAINDISLVRPEKVDAARASVSDTKFPPDAMLKAVAALIAKKMP